VLIEIEGLRPPKFLPSCVFVSVPIEGHAAPQNFDPMKDPRFFFLCFPFLHAFFACLCNPGDLCPCVQSLLPRS
jgi:hypothetical protein